MSFSNTVNNRKKILLGDILLILLCFLAGFRNSEGYLNVLGVGIISYVLQFIFYIVLSFCLVLLSVEFLIKKKKLSFKSLHWFPLTVIVLMKFLLLFLLEPSIFAINQLEYNGTHRYARELFVFFTNMSLLIVVTTLITRKNNLDKAILSCGIGVGLALIIPFVFFPEEIGRRVSSVSGVEFYGFFWNPAVVSFISIFWLVVALLVKTKSIFKKLILVSICSIIVLGGLAGLSRGMLLSLLLSFFSYLIYTKKLKVAFKFFVIIATLISVLLLLFPMIIENYSARINTDKSIFEEARVYIWKEYLMSIGEYFTFGAWLEGPRYSSQGFGPHSVLLNWFTRFGFLGLLTFLWLIAGLVKSARYVKQLFSKEQAASLFSWIIAYFSVSLVNETGFTQSSVYVAFGVILAWGNICYKLKSSRDESQSLMNDYNLQRVQRQVNTQKVV